MEGAHLAVELLSVEIGRTSDSSLSQFLSFTDHGHIGLFPWRAQLLDDVWNFETVLV